MRLAAGGVIGPYTIVSAIGAGAMGEVYRAHDPRLGRDVAIKVLSSSRSSDRDQKRFLQEARSASALSHPNVVTVHEVGEDDGLRYVVMELVEGERLRDVLRRGPLPLRRALQIARSISAGLAAAHLRGVTHRDLKPENVMIARDGLVKLVDFGLARVESPMPADTEATVEMPERLTQEGMVVGTVGYMSPEQLSRSAGDARSDQFALGVVLFEMLTGHPPFERPLPLETMYAILREPAPSLRDVPPEVAMIVARCLEKNPNDRYAVTEDLTRAIDSVLETFTASGSGSSRQHLYRTGSLIRPVAAALLLAIVAGAAWYALRSGSSGPALPESRQLAILFTGGDGDPDSDVWVDGLAQVVGARLGYSDRLQVIMPMKGVPGRESRDPAQFARDAGANLLLRGTVHRDGVRTRIAYAVMDPKTGRQLAGAVLTGRNDDIFGLQDQLADRVAHDLRVTGDAPESTAPDVPPAAADEYLKALGLLQRYDDLASVDRAVAMLEDLATVAPESAPVRTAAARAHLARYDLTFEPASLERAARQFESAERLDGSLPEIHLIRGKLALQRGDSAAAVREMRAYLAGAPLAAPAVLAYADALAANGDDAEAERQFRRAIELRPSYWAGHNRLGHFYAQRGRTDEAIALFTRAATLSPDNARVEANLGAVYVQKGRLNEALTLLTSAADEMPTSEVWSNLGTTQYLMGKIDDAVPAYERATQLTPADPYLWANLGDALRWSTHRRRDARSAYGSAISHGESLLKLNPSDALLTAVVANAYAKSGSKDRARVHIARAVKLAPEDPVVNYHAAIAAAVIGDESMALEHLRVAVANGYPVAEAQRERELESLRSTTGFKRLISRTPPPLAAN